MTGPTIGDLYDRVPPTGEWTLMPEYDLVVRRTEAPDTVQIMPARHAPEVSA